MDYTHLSTIGIFAHANAGKTTLTEHLLYHTGVINSIGRVDSGNSTTDMLFVERRRGISVRASFVSFCIGSTKFQLIDTPGHVDFSAEVVRAVSVIDGAILVISAVEGIEAQTTFIWKLLKERNIPVIIYINKLDRLGANFDWALAQIREKITDAAVPICHPIIEENQMMICPYSDEELLSQLVEVDELSMEYYFGEERQEQWPFGRSQTLSKSAKLFPVFCGSALQDIGVTELMPYLEKYLPSTKRDESNREFSGYIYNVSFLNGIRESSVKILSGCIINRMNLEYEGQLQKIRSLAIKEGSKLISVERASSGEIAIVTGLELPTGTVLGNEDPRYTGISRFSPLFTSQIWACDKSKSNELLKALTQFGLEDPSLNVRYNTASHQIQIDLMGELQGETLVEMLRERYQLSTEVAPPSIIYRETPLGVGLGKASYTRVSNVMLKVSPLKRGSGLQFKSSLSVNYLFSKYQKQTEKLIYSYAKSGIFGWEITDALVELVGGKCDHVGSEAVHYSICVPIALMRALQDCGTQLLEPLMEYSLQCPEEYFQKMLAEVSTYSLTYNTDYISSEQIEIAGTARLSDIMALAHKLKKLTSGKCTLAYQRVGYVEAIDGETHVNELVDVSPATPEEFVLSLNGSLQNLDKGINDRRRRPERVKRNKHLWEGNRAPKKLTKSQEIAQQQKPPGK